MSAKEPGLIKFAGVCCVYDDDLWLPYMLESVLSEVSALYVLISERPWNGNPTDNSATWRVLRESTDPAGKLKIVPGTWADETQQRRAAYEIVAREEYDYCLIVDADEIYDPPVLRRMQQTAVEHPEIGCWYMTCLTYWKSYRFRIDPPESYKPPVFLKVGQCSLGDRRWATAASRAAIPPQIGVCHHMSYARTNEQLRRKITTFSHAQELVPDWYEKVWLRWDGEPGLENLHPVTPPVYRRAVAVAREQLPPVLQKLWDREAGK